MKRETPDRPGGSPRTPRRQEPGPAPQDGGAAGPVPEVCNRCGAVNGQIVVHLAAFGITQTIPGCRHCSRHRTS